MAMFRAQIPDIFINLLPLLESVAYHEYDAATTVYDKVTAIEKNPPKGSFMNKTGVVGTGLMATKPEGKETPEDRPYQGYDKKFTYSKYGLMVLTSDEALNDDNYGVTQQHTEALGRSGQATRETHCASMLNTGFDTLTTPDGQYLFATAHTLPRGGTFANRLSSHVDLSYTSLQLILNLFDDMVEIAGMALNIIPRNLIYPTALQFVANEVLKSQYRPDNAHMATNSVGDLFPLNPIKWPVYLTDTDAWFVSAEPANTGLLLVDREAYKVTSDYDASKQVGETIATMRYDYGAWRAHGIAGSAGA